MDIRDIIAGLERMKRLGARRVVDMASNPSAYLEQVGDNMANINAGRRAVASGGSLGYQNLPQDERLAQMSEAALDSFGGGLGVLRVRGPVLRKVQDGRYLYIEPTPFPDGSRGGASWTFQRESARPTTYSATVANEGGMPSPFGDGFESLSSIREWLRGRENGDW